MTLQQQLSDALNEMFTVERSGAEGFILTPDGGTFSASVRLTASEADLAAFAEKNAASGIEALGEVKGDVTGKAAAIGLLAVHIEETMAADDRRSLHSLRLGADGLEAEYRG